MAFNLKSTANVGFENGVNILVYGGIGTQKTRMILTAPNPVIFATEKGLISIRESNLPYNYLESESQIEEAILWAENSEEANQFDTFCIDSLTELAQIILEEQLPLHTNKMQAYGVTLLKTCAFTKRIKNLKHNTYFTAKESYDKDAQGRHFSKIDLLIHKLPKLQLA